MPTLESQLKKGFASNLKGANKVIMLSSMIQDCEVGWIFSLDVQVCQKKQSEFKIKRERAKHCIQAIQLDLSKVAPNFVS